jgi:hypothetical protein
MSAFFKSSGQYLALVKFMNRKIERPIKAMIAAPMNNIVGPPSITHFWSRLFFAPAPGVAACANKQGIVIKVVVRIVATNLFREVASLSIIGLFFGG